MEQNNTKEYNRNLDQGRRDRKREERKGECDGKRLRQRVTTLRVALAQSTLAEETEEDTDAAFYAATGSTNKISLIAQIIEAFFK